MNKKTKIISGISVAVAVIVIVIIGFSFKESNNSKESKIKDSTHQTENKNKSSQSDSSINSDVKIDNSEDSNTEQSGYYEGDDSEYTGTNEYHQEGFTFKDNGDVIVKNESTNNEEVTITQADVDSDRETLNKAGLPGGAYSKTDLVNLRILATNENIDIITAANIPK